MNVQIPIAGLTLSDGQTYNGQLPVWATRPLMIRVTPDFISSNEYPVYVRVSNGGAVKKEITLPYQEVVYLDLSFAAPLLTRADRNKSEGNPAFPQQVVAIWSASFANRITLPVFHCDETYWDTLGVDGALPQPPKPHIPGQTLDIYFPYRIHPLDAFQVEVEPVTGAPSDVIFPTTYVLGNTIDIKYIKKLTIKNVWGSGLDQVINYEDKLYTDVIYDESLQCALRARWNMRNGQWFWTAFKDYFWSNKFTPIRGRGGVTEQAELTINLEYGEEWYNVYQELLVSSNVVFDLNLPGINQYQNKRFRAEVMGDTGARWSNSTKTYRQQVRFRTTELQDNYMFPPAPDQPPTPAIQFSAQFNPWVIGSAEYTEGVWNNIYSNAAWEVQSEPSWLTVINGTTLFTPEDFAQGGFSNYAPLTPPEAWVDNSPNYIRLKKPINSLAEVYSLISVASGYQVQVYYINSAGTGATPSAWFNTGVGRRNLEAYSGFLILLHFSNGSPITPNEVSNINMRWGKRYYQLPAGTSSLTATAAANTGEARTGNIVLKSKAGAVTYTIPITQQKASISLSPSSVLVSSDAATGKLTTVITANTSWEIVPGYASWIAPTYVSSGGAGTNNMYFNIQANTGAQRTANITFRSKVNTNVTAILSVTQAGISGNISADMPTFNVAYRTFPMTVNVTSFGNWSVSQRDTWITPSVSTGANGTTAVMLTIADNASNADRTGTITFYNDPTGNIVVVTVNQTGAPTSIIIAPSRISGPKAGTGSITPAVAESENNWTMVSAPSWVSITPTSGEAGQTAIGVKYGTANPGAARTGQLRIKNTVTNEIAICLITQKG